MKEKSDIVELKSSINKKNTKTNSKKNNHDYDISIAGGLCETKNLFLTKVYEIYEQEINQKNARNIYIYGNFNNSIVQKELNDLGILFIDSTKDLNSNDIVIIKSLIKKEDLDYLDNNKITYYDMTCNKINNIKKEIIEKYNNDYVMITCEKNLLIDTFNTYVNNKINYIKNYIKNINKLNIKQNQKVLLLPIRKRYSKYQFYC